jgi:streptogramin lyase
VNRSGWRSHLTALLTALITCVGLLSLSTAPAWAAAGTVTEFPIRSSPVVITAGPDGALWFTECALDSNGNCTANGKIGRITTGDAQALEGGLSWLASQRFERSCQLACCLAVC